MKAKVITTALLALCFAVPSQAQFLEKLKKKAEQAVERTVLNRTDKEVSKGTDKTIDGAMGKNQKKHDDARAQAMQKKMQSMMGGASMEKVPDQYNFSYKAVMKISSDKSENQMEYWFEPAAQYFGSKLENGKTTTMTVTDMENQTMVMFMNDGETRMAMPMSSDKEMFEEFEEKMDQKILEEKDLDLTPIEGKTILGYNCKGYQVKNEEGTYKMWITDETPVGFIEGISHTEYIPSRVLPLEKNSMVMEMQFEPVNGKHKPFNMRCVQFIEEKTVVTKSDYNTMSGF